MEASNEYFMLQVLGGRAPAHMAYQAYKNSVWLTANTKLADVHLAARLSTQDLAERAAKALTPVIKKRRGEDAEIRVVPAMVMSRLDARDLRRVAADSALMEARLAQGVFAPNKRPVMP